MKRLLLPLLAAFTSPANVNAESVRLLLRATHSSGAALLFGKNNNTIAGKDQIQNANTIPQGFKNFRSN